MPDLSTSKHPNSVPKLVSLVIPFFNEEVALARLYDKLMSCLAALPDYRFEIVCVDDGSSDNTLAGLLALRLQDARFHVLELSRNFGKEAALTAGIDAATGDAVIPMDADLQDPPELIDAMLAEWSAGAEVVVARRADRSADSLAKRKTAEFFYRIHNLIADMPIPDNVGDFRLMDRIVVDALKQLPERQRFMKGLFAWVGFKTVTLDYSRRVRVRGDSKFSSWRLWNLAIEGLTSFSTAPLRIWSYIGALGAIASFIYGSLIIIRTLVLGADVPGYPSLLVAILFFGSLQLISIGVLGEYIGRIYLETKRRPIYLLRRHYGAVDAQATANKDVL
jgi:glycosyltransferase involved in cell wall biosynthesis